MNWSIGLKQRDKIALALGAVFLIIVLANWFMNYSMKQISGQFKSVYEDRLVPALDISAITERTYENHMLVEEHILATAPGAKIRLSRQIAQNQSEIDSILAKFEQTYLTKTEGESLLKYKSAQQNLAQVHSKILALSQNETPALARDTYNTTGKATFMQLLEPLHALSNIQQTVGHDLLDSAERQMKAIKVLTYLVIGMALIIALLVATLLQTSRKLNSIKHQKFHLN